MATEEKGAPSEEAVAPSEDAVAPTEVKPAPSAEMPPPSIEVDDSGDLRGYHFRRLMKKKVTLIVGGLLILAAAAGGGIGAGPLIGAAAAAGVVLLIVITIFFIAYSKSEDAFFDLYAKQRGLNREAVGNLGPQTPLLCKGDERKATQVMRGKLAEGMGGTLALFTYTDVYYDKNGRQENNYNFTVAITKVPEVAEVAPKIICNRKFGFRAFEKLEDAFRGDERVRLESVELDDRFEIFVDDKQDPNWIRQLFSPTFIVWLAEQTPEKFAFELVDGHLVCNVKGHKKNAAELDGMVQAMGGVTQRLKEEAAEGIGFKGHPADSDQPAQ
jgi:hypothetical protein